MPDKIQDVSKEIDKMKNATLDEKLIQCANCACFNLRKAARAVTQLYDEALRPVGIRGTQYTLLTLTKLLGPIALTELAEIVVLDRTTLTRNLGPLERDGYVEIVPGIDKRKRLVRITKKGEDTLLEAFPIWRMVQERVVNGIGQEGWGTVLPYLNDMVAITRE